MFIQNIIYNFHAEIQRTGSRSDKKKKKEFPISYLAVRLCVGVFFAQVVASWPFVAKR